MHTKRLERWSVVSRPDDERPRLARAGRLRSSVWPTHGIGVVRTFDCIQMNWKSQKTTRSDVYRDYYCRRFSAVYKTYIVMRLHEYGWTCIYFVQVIMVNHKNAIKLPTETGCDQWISRILTARNKWCNWWLHLRIHSVKRAGTQHCRSLEKWNETLKEISERIFRFFMHRTSEIIDY